VAACAGSADIKPKAGIATTVRRGFTEIKEGILPIEKLAKVNTYFLHTIGYLKIFLYIVHVSDRSLTT
jgi:hypothetical protein